MPAASQWEATLSDAKKLRRAAADQLGCDPSALALLEVAPSRIPDFNRGGTTTWVELQDEDGNLSAVVMESVLGLDTPYVVPGADGEPRCRTVCGSAEFAKLNALYGRDGAREVSQHDPQYPGSAEDRDDDERIRSMLGSRIRRNAERMMLEEQQNTRDGAERFKAQHAA